MRKVAMSPVVARNELAAPACTAGHFGTGRFVTWNAIRASPTTISTIKTKVSATCLLGCSGDSHRIMVRPAKKVNAKATAKMSPHRAISQANSTRPILPNRIKVGSSDKTNARARVPITIRRLGRHRPVRILSIRRPRSPTMTKETT